MFARFRSLAVLGAVAIGAGCSGPSSSPNPQPVAAPSPSTAPVAVPDLDAAPLPPTPQLPAGASLTGEQVVEYVCSQCHSMEPPPLKAPPLTHLASHLRQTFASVDEAVTHVTAYAPAPDAERSILNERARERFGLMPPQPLPTPMLEAAARYIWTLSDGTGAAMEPRGTGGRGMGNGMMRNGEAGGAMGGEGMRCGRTGDGMMGNGMMRRGGAMAPDSAPPSGRGRGMNRGGGGGGR